jgi:hypothetical protein
MRILTTPDGAKQFSGWFDTQRNEECGFQVASDGVTRCMPTSIALSGGYFADAACAIPAVLSSCTPGYVATYSQVSTCPAYVKYGPVFAAVTTSALFIKNGAQCVSSSVPAGFTAYRAFGAEIAPSNFQSATVTTE